MLHRYAWMSLRASVLGNSGFLPTHFHGPKEVYGLDDWVSDRKL